MNETEQTEKRRVMAIIPPLVLIGAGLAVGQWSVYLASGGLFTIACVLGLTGMVWLGGNSMNRFFDD